MSWLRIDDGYDTHPKLFDLTEQQRWRWTRVLIHCARHRTDGFVSGATLRELGLTRALPKLLEVKLLDQTPDGYTVHDWHDFNPKDPTKAERQARWRAKTAESVDGRVDGGVDAQTVYTVDAPVDGQTVHSRAGTRARSRPVPSPTRPNTPTQPTPSLEHPARPGRVGGEEETDLQPIGDTAMQILREAAERNDLLAEA